jgi:hypothetical protein
MSALRERQRQPLESSGTLALARSHLAVDAVAQLAVVPLLADGADEVRAGQAGALRGLTAVGATPAARGCQLGAFAEGHAVTLPVAR